MVKKRHCNDFICASLSLLIILLSEYYYIPIRKIKLCCWNLYLKWRSRFTYKVAGNAVLSDHGAVLKWLMHYRPPNANLDSGCQTASIVTGDNGCRHLSVVTPGRLCWPTTLLRYAHKRIVNIMKVYIERNNLQLELIKIWTFTFAKR